MGSGTGSGLSGASVSSNKRKRDEPNDTVEFSKSGPSSVFRNDEIEPGARPKKKKKKNKIPAPAVFAFDSGELRSLKQPVALQVCRIPCFLILCLRTTRVLKISYTSYSSEFST